MVKESECDMKGYCRKACDDFFNETRWTPKAVDTRYALTSLMTSVRLRKAKQGSSIQIVPIT
jgi:hypothetical protein